MTWQVARRFSLARLMAPKARSGGGFLRAAVHAAMTVAKAKAGPPRPSRGRGGRGKGRGRGGGVAASDAADLAPPQVDSMKVGLVIMKSWSMRVIFVCFA